MGANDMLKRLTNMIRHLGMALGGEREGQSLEIVDNGICCF